MKFVFKRALDLSDVIAYFDTTPEKNLRTKLTTLLKKCVVAN